MGQSPFEGVAGDSAAAPGQGKTFPFKHATSLQQRFKRMWLNVGAFLSIVRFAQAQCQTDDAFGQLAGVF
jgi:hypothetical protein